MRIRVAVISDIHSNLQALRAVFDDIEKQNIDEIYCLGDVVGYGAQPLECVEMVMGNPKVKLMLGGNHDYSIVKMAIDPDEIRLHVNPNAWHALTYSYERLSGEIIKLMASWPEIMPLNDLDITLAHGAVSFDHAWQYVRNPDAARFELKHSPTSICLLGHTHEPSIFGEKDGRYLENQFLTRNLDGYRFVINVGSVGQPRDLVPNSAYGIYELSGQHRTYTLRRVEYDVSAAIKLIWETDLPKELAYRLAQGK